MNKYLPDLSQTNAVSRLTALWALSEAALGGVLHAFRIPFTGLFIGSTAVIVITLISFFSRQRGDILKATIMVMVVKGMVSPHTPVTAYFAVAIQGLSGEIFFRFISNKKIAAFTLGFVALSLSAFQKVIITTAVFGMNIWKSIDLFGTYVLKQFSVDPALQETMHISLLLILIYSFFHVLAGIGVGIAAPVIGERLFGELKNNENGHLFHFNETQSKQVKRSKRKGWLRRFSGKFLFLIALAVIILSYVYPVFEKSHGAAALIMLLRSFMVMGIWYYLIAPILLRRIRNFLDKKQNVYASDISSIIDTLPLLRLIVQYSWKSTKKHNHLKRYKQFILILLVLILTYDSEAVQVPSALEPVN